MGDLVDALVVGVDERLARRDESTHLGDQGRRHPVAGVSRTWSRWASVKPECGELGPGDHRRALPDERRPWTGSRSGGRCCAGVAVRGGPAQHVEDLAVDRHAVADTPCSPGGRPVVIDVSAVAVVVGATVRIGPPSSAASVGAIGRRSCSWSQPRPSSTSSTTWSALDCDRGQPRQAGVLELTQQGGHHVGDARPVVVGEHELIAHRASFRRLGNLLSGGRPSRPPPVAPGTPTMGRCRYGPDVKVSTRGDYAQPRPALPRAARRTSPGPTSVRDIAERTGLPQPYLEQILLALKGAGLVRSKRGVGGGYVLARAPVGDHPRRHRQRRRRPHRRRRLRRAPPGRRLRPRGPVRAAGRLGRTSATSIRTPPRSAHPRRHRSHGPRRAALARRLTPSAGPNEAQDRTARTASRSAGRGEVNSHEAPVTGWLKAMRRLWRKGWSRGRPERSP